MMLSGSEVIVLSPTYVILNLESLFIRFIRMDPHHKLENILTVIIPYSLQTVLPRVRLREVGNFPGSHS